MPKETPGIVFPLEVTEDNSGYKLADIQETVRFNVKNIILTNPGERIMIPDFGVGIMNLLFERVSFEIVDDARQRIVEQIATYAPYITIIRLSIRPIDEISINIKLNYEIEFAQIVDSIDLDITNI